MRAFLSALAWSAMPLVSWSADPITEVQFVQTSTGRIKLHQERGHCQALAKSAIYVPDKGEPIQGCWLLRGPLVAIVFFDGDIAQVPVAMLRRAVPV
jgi:hypothetical protein